MPERAAPDTVEWAVATRCRPGEATSGDVGVVVPLPEGALVAGIDGLGHGEEAARAARAAADAVRQGPSEDLVLLLRRCHDALRGSRGAAISLAFVSPSTSTMSWLGIGNVEGRLLSRDSWGARAKGSLAVARGVAGHELPTVSTATLDVRPGDVLVLASDGIEASFADSLDVSGSPRAISERILADSWKPRDDALVVTLRYLGVRS